MTDMRQVAVKDADGREHRFNVVFLLDVQVKNLLNGIHAVDLRN